MAEQLNAFERAWFTIIEGQDEMEEAIRYIRAFVEKAALSKTRICLEVYTDKPLPRLTPDDMQIVVNNAPQAAG